LTFQALHMKMTNIGIIVNNNHVKAWQHLVILKLFRLEGLQFVIINTSDSSIDNDTTKQSVVYMLHEKLDKKIFRKKFNFNKKIDIKSFTKEIPVFDLNSFGIDLFNSENDSIAEYLHKYDLDFILNFGLQNCGGKFTQAARKGIISYILDGENVANPYPPCYWEMVKSVPKIGASLILTDFDGKNSVLLKVSLSTYPNSIHINRDQIYKLAVLIIPRLIKKFNTSGELPVNNTLDSSSLEVETQHAENYDFNLPGSFVAIKNIGKLFFRFLSRNLFYKELGLWSVLYTQNRSSDLLDLQLNTFCYLKYKKGTFIADPFIINKEGISYIFIEEYDYKKAKGHISVTSIDSQGNQSSIQKIIENPFHMSYPFVFEVDGTHYIIPETSSDHTIQLYRCIDFPGKWEFQQNLMDNINAKDSTLFYFDKKWWLFTSVNDAGIKELVYNELFLYYSDDVFSGKWQSHPLNPIVTDPKLSRSAGKIFQQDGNIYRPSQDCLGNYGNAINFCKITVLNEHNYEEVTVSKIKPDWDSKLKGLHTYNFDDQFAVIDVFQSRSKI